MGQPRDAWRPQHIHFSVFGRMFKKRLVTQMYFPGDPLFELDPIFHAVRDPEARGLMVARFDLDATQPDWALAYRWDIVLGLGATPMDDSTVDRRPADRRPLPHDRAPADAAEELADPGDRRRRICTDALFDGDGEGIVDGMVEALGFRRASAGAEAAPTPAATSRSSSRSLRRCPARHHGSTSSCSRAACSATS